MYELDLETTLWLLALALAALLAVSGASVPLSLAPHLAHRAALRDLRRAVQREADEHAAKPEPRRRHNAHCPACGRFARVTSSGPRGVRTRCAAHGIRLRATKRIGRPDTVLVRLTPHRPVVALPLTLHEPIVEHVDAMRPTYRLEDAIDIIARGLPVRPLGRLAA